jgi:hypothetical protein
VIIGGDVSYLVKAPKRRRQGMCGKIRITAFS